MFAIFALTFLFGAVFLLTLKLSSYQDVQQRIRQAVAFCYFWHWKRRHGLLFKFEADKTDNAKNGFKFSPEVTARENPRTLTSDQNAIDSVGFQGTSNDGQALMVRIVRHHDRCSEVVVYMRLASGEEYKLPAHPDCLVYNTDGKAFSASGLTLEVLEPLRCWRISFNGTLMRVSAQVEIQTDGSQENEESVQVQFHFIWKPMSDYVAFPHDYQSNILADQMAKQHSSTTDLLQTLDRLVNEGERYEQFGTCHGRVTVGEGKEQTMLLRGIKERKNGIQDLNSIKSRISINGVTTHGASFHLFAINSKTGQSLIYGYIAAPCNTVIRHVYQWSADLNQSVSVDTFHLSLKAEHRNFELEMTSATKELSVYCGEDTKFREDIRIFKFKLNGKNGYGFVQSVKSTDGHSNFINRKSLPQLTEPDIKTTDRMVVTFKDVECRSSNIVGGKGSSLALMTLLGQSDWQFPIQFEVPQGVCVTNLAFERHLKDNPEVVSEIKTLEQIAWKQTEGSMEHQCERLVCLVQDTVLSHALKMQLKSALLETLGKEFEEHKFAVRSSAIGEDGEDLSAAGQNETFLGIKGLEETSSAIVKCWASQFSHRSIEYKRQNGQLLNAGMAVVVQKMVPADMAGVLFTNHPVTGSRAHMLISSNYGLGESVVSGSADPDTILLKRNWDDKLSVLEKQVGEKKLRITMSDMNGTIESEVDAESASKISITDEMAIKLGLIAIYLEQSWGSARDIEWAIKEHKIYLLQSRPVTTDSTLTDFEVQHEFDTVLRTDEEVFSTANVGEVFPGSNTPLSYSTVIRSFLLRFNNNILWKTRRHRYDPTVFEGFLLAYNHVFFNRIAGMFLSLGEKKTALMKALEIGIYGYVIEDDDVLQRAMERVDKPPFLASSKVLVFTLTGLFFGKWIMRNARKKFGRYPPRARNANTIQEAYRDIDEHFFNLDEGFEVHLYSSLPSQVWSLIVLTCLAGEKEYTMDQYTDVAKLTSGVSGTESGDVPHSLQELAASIADDIEPNQFRSMSIQDALKQLSEGQLPSSKKYNEFMERHGHRGYKEFDVGSKTWNMEPEKLVKILQEMLKNAESLHCTPSNAPETDVMSTLLTPLTPMKKRILRWANMAAKNGVKQRELSKACITLGHEFLTPPGVQLSSLFIRIIDGFRKGYGHLARLMVANGMLPDEDLLFYLTHEEIGIVMETRSAKLIRRAKQRQRMCAIMEDYKFPHIFSGIAEPSNLNKNDVDLSGLTQVTGYPVSQGVVQGPARVIHSFSEVNTIQQGDILVTRCTDIGWTPYFPMLAGIVTEIGGLVSHGAVVAREFGLPCIVAAANATSVFKSGETVLLNANKGVLARVTNIE